MGRYSTDSKVRGCSDSCKKWCDQHFQSVNKELLGTPLLVHDFHISKEFYLISSKQSLRSFLQIIFSSLLIIAFFL